MCPHSHAAGTACRSVHARFSVCAWCKTVCVQAEWAFLQQLWLPGLHVLCLGRFRPAWSAVHRARATHGEVAPHHPMAKARGAEKNGGLALLVTWHEGSWLLRLHVRGGAFTVMVTKIAGRWRASKCVCVSPGTLCSSPIAKPSPARPTSIHLRSGGGEKVVRVRLSVKRKSVYVAGRGSTPPAAATQPHVRAVHQPSPATHRSG